MFVVGFFMVLVFLLIVTIQVLFTPKGERLEAVFDILYLIIETFLKLIGIAFHFVFHFVTRPIIFKLVFAVLLFFAVAKTFF